MHGEIELPVIVTKDIVAGVVAVPHGWGHKGTGGWRLANKAPGANVNRLDVQRARRSGESGGNGAPDGCTRAGRPCVNQIRWATSALTAWSRKSGGISGHSWRH
jgi:hypothetical protein